jgi:hypothetical protein
MKKVLFALVFLLMVTISEGAIHPISDGNSLSEGLRLLNNEKTTVSEDQTGLVAMSYVQGFLHGCAVSWSANRNLPFTFPKEGLGTQQFLKIVQKYLNHHPDRLHERAEFLLFLALRDSFPNPEYKEPLS